MAFGPNDALEAARNIAYGPRVVEAERLNRIARALSPRNTLASPDGVSYIGDGQGQVGYVTVEIPKDAPVAMQRLALKARTNFLPLVVDTFSQAMKVDGILSSATDAQSKVWKYGWQANNLDARQTGVHRSALAYGASYATILPGDTGPVIKGVSPRQLTAVYSDPVDDDWPMMAIRVDGDMVRLYDEEMVHFIGVESQPRSGLGASLTVAPGVDWVYLEGRAHGAPYCPIARFRDRMLLEGEEQYGIIEPLLDIQQRIDETNFGMLVAQYFAAFKQRYVVGWIPISEQDMMKATAADFWAFKDADVKVGQFEETDLTRYIDSKESALMDMAAIAQLAPPNFGGGVKNVSAEALALIQGGEERKGSEIMTSFGESWEMVARTAAYYHQDDATAADDQLEVRWRQLSSQPLAATVDALGKMAQMLGLPPEVLWPMIPGLTDQDIERAQKAVTQQDLMAQLQQTLTAESVPGGTPAHVADVAPPR